MKNQYFNFVPITLLLIFLSSSMYAQMTLTFSNQVNHVCDGNPCNYSGPSILINEVMLTPSTHDGSIYGTGTGFYPGDNEGEWIELYNPDLCKSVDISCFYLGNNTADPSPNNYGGGYRIPNNTIVPPRGFVVIRGVYAPPVPANLLVQNGGNTIEYIVDNGLSNVCLGPGASRLWFPNSGGWFAFYNAAGIPQDAISWSGTTNSCMSCNPCIPSCSGCANTTSLPSYDAIPANLKTYITAQNPGDFSGQSWRRIPDGGAWSSSASTPTIGNCNSICNPPPVITCDGQVTVTVSGGTPPYSFIWNDQQASHAATATGLCAGNYCVTVTDANNNTQTGCVDIVNFEPTVTFNTVTPICVNTNPFNLTSYVSPAGGTFSGTGVTGTNFNPATAGVGTHTISYVYADPNTCEDSVAQSITVSPLPVLSTTYTDENCGQSNGSVTVNPVGTCTQGFTYLWNTLPQQNTQTALNLSAGTYIVTVTCNGCSVSATATVTNVAGPSVSISSITNSACSLANGSATAIANGGTGPYSYNWSCLPVQNSNTMSNVPAGTYNVTVTDANNCIATNTVTISTFPLPVASITEIVDATCNQSDGSANLTVSSGTQPYTFSWSTNPSQTTQNLQNVPTGTYSVTVTDANGCMATANVTIGQEGPTTTISSTGENCGQSNGTASVVASGGTGTYTYNWNTSPPQTTVTAVGLSAGIYTVTVNDGGCTTTATVTVMIIPGPTAGFSAYPEVLTLMDGPVLFFDNSSGNIVNWQWNFGDNSLTASGAETNHQYQNLGTYVVTLIVTDNKGCTDTVTDTIKIREIFTLYVPNAFTPDGDGINDFFFPEGVNVDPDYFDMTIFDRWGNIIFHTNTWVSTHGDSWNGTKNNSGTFKEVVIDVYVYRILIKEIQGPKHEYIGSVTLIK